MSGIKPNSLTSAMPYVKVNGMETTDQCVAMDKAGRIVLPKPVRERLHLLPGTEFELHIEPGFIKLTPHAQEPALASKDGVLVHQGNPTGDLAQAVEEMRKQRLREVGGM